MKDLAFNLFVLTGGYARMVEEETQLLREVATKAMDAVRKVDIADVRANIAQAGLGIKWQNATRAKTNPDRAGVYSLHPSVYLHHRIPYAGVFEDGATIKGNPLLWIPLPDTPKRIGSKRLTPELYATSIGDLWSFKSKAGTPLLGARVRVPRRSAGGRLAKVSLSRLRRGTSAGTGVLQTIPLYVGIRQTNISRRLSVFEIGEASRDRYPEFYARNFSHLAGA